MDGIEIRELTDEDLSSVANIHCLGFSESALTKLGKKAVRRYYQWQLNGPHDVFAIGAFHGHLLVGFCFGGVFSGALSGFVRKNRAYLMGLVMLRPWLLFDRIVRNQLSVGVKMGKRKIHSQTKKHSLKKTSFGILSVVVHPEMQNSGIGAMLMSAAEEEARRRKMDELNLTVNEQNQAAIQFYEKLGWKRTIPDTGNWRGRMRKTLTSV
jgi:ribosomal protein S18 acetylase RimI-like enzyme